MPAKRNYKKEYSKFQSSTKQKKKRAERNRLRKEAEKAGKVKKGDKKDISHTKNGARVKPRSVNRGSKSDMPGDRKARGKGQTKKQPSRKRLKKK